MDVGILALRLLHVGAAILWAGGGILVGRFVAPAGRQVGSAAKPFLEHLGARVGPYFPIVATVTVLAGSVLYWIDSNGDPVRYLTGGGMGTGLGVGALAAWAAWLLGAIVIGPSEGRVARLDARLREAGEAPPAELVAARAAAQARGRAGARIEEVCLVVAIVCMATARYWP